MRRVQRRAIVLLVVTPVLGLLVWAACISKPTGYMMSSPFPMFLDPAVSLADVRAIAAGSGGDGTLVKRIIAMTAAINERLPGRRSIEAGFATPATSRDRSSAYGWPTPWVRIERTLNYRDAVRKEGFVPATTDRSAAPLGMYEGPSNPLRVPPGPRWRWEGHGLRYQVQPEEAGGVFTVYRFNLPAMVLSVVIAAAAWKIGCVLLARRQRSGSLSRRSRLAALVVVAMLIGVLAAVFGGTTDRSPYVFPAMKQANFPPAPVYFTREGFARLGIDADGLKNLSAKPDGDRVLATALLKDAPHPEGDPASLYVAATYDAEASVGPESKQLTLTYNFPVVLMGREEYLRRPDFGAVEPMAPRGGVDVEFKHGMLWLTLSRAAPGSLAYWFGINLEMLGVFAGLALLAAWAVRGTYRRVLVRRRARGLCPQCRYPVAINV
jgi:hypothetical protein